MILTLVIDAASGAAKAATDTIPIVFFYGGDPVAGKTAGGFGKPHEMGTTLPTREFLAVAI
jgi:hypothetical protein